MSTLPANADQSQGHPDALAEARAAIEAGDFGRAHQVLEPLIADPDGPVTAEPARLKEIMRRIRLDHSLDAEGVRARIAGFIPDVTPADVERWTKSGALQHRVIDGEIRYFNRAHRNLMLFNDEAKQRRVRGVAPAGYAFSTTDLAETLTDAWRQSDDATFFPVKHHITYSITVPKDHPRMKPGATVRVWLPCPQAYRQQRDVKLVRTEQPGSDTDYVLAPNGTPQRTLFFEHTVTETDEDLRFLAEYEYVNAAYRPHVKLADVKPYDESGEIYQTYTAERPPHIVFTPLVKRIVGEVVAGETNPLAKARKIFRWVSENVPWCAEMEYSTIFNLSDKGLTAGRGDCGVQALSFITLCRAAGVPARWQSGFQTHPNDWNLHDWTEFYIEPYGWLPADPSFGVRTHEDDEVAMFYCGGLDPYRWIVNLDYARELHPPKTSFRSEPNDFQRGEVEIDGHNLYFGEWRWSIDLETYPMSLGVDGLELALKSIVPDLMNAGDIPGAVIGVGHQDDGEFNTWQQAYGFIQTTPESAKKPMPEDAVFDLASLTKPIATGTSIMTLVEAGKVDLDAPVARYLPEFDTPDKRAITVKHLMTHTSGMPPYLDNTTQKKLKAEHGFPCPEPTQAAIRAIEPTHAPGEKVVYSCLNAILCAEIVETVSGQSLSAYAKEHIFDPLKMFETGFADQLDDDLPFVPTTRTDYGKGADGFLCGQVHDPIAALQAGASGNAGLFGNVDDLHRFAQMMLNGGELDGVRILKPETVKMMTRPVFPDAVNKDGNKDRRGLLWDLYPGLGDSHANADKPYVYGHTGYTGTYIRLDPEHGRYAIILTNRVHPDDSGKVAELRREVWTMVQDVLGPPAPTQTQEPGPISLDR